MGKLKIPNHTHKVVFYQRKKSPELLRFCRSEIEAKGYVEYLPYPYKNNCEIEETDAYRDYLIERSIKC